MTSGPLLRVAFFGTPEFAVPSLEALLSAGFEVPVVVTQPDRPVGRHAVRTPSAVGALAAGRGIRVEKPESVRGNAALLEHLEAVGADAFAVVAYGRIFPRELLGMPRLGCVNVHASLLPRWRGASPIQAAILAGDAETGMATMRMEEGLDTGPVYLESRVAIGARETAGELAERLSRLGGAILVETLRGLAAGGLTARPQVGEATVCRPIRREDALADFERPADEIVRRLRAFTPWPGLHTTLGGERIKILDADVWPPGSSRESAPGDVALAGSELVVAAGGGTALRLLRLQRAGRRPATGPEFARGAPLPGRFGSAK